MSYIYNAVYSHFKGDNITRVELIERLVAETVINTKIPDEKRSWGKVFELKHSSSVIQIGRLLAEKRGLDIELTAVMSALHDIYVNLTGRISDHAHKGVPIAEKMLEKTNKFKEKEIAVILKGIKNHSDKHIISKDPYVEFMKDADVLDCSMYVGVHDAYLYEKSEKIVRTYFARIKKIRKELGLPKDDQWNNFKMITKI
ncbi:MAG: HD domain-containing protein [bacterium]